ncbi:MAG TPA: hypothetical protein VHY22_05195 [Chthoniobacteraceae bacterium]|jgi:TolA-binding protein|nr:hypothetical protein [Chthoniobacteraceae bacterium]
MKRHPYLLIAGFALVTILSARGDDANSPENRLREMLKNTIVQLRTAEQQNDTLQSQVTDLQSQISDLTKKLADLTKKDADTQVTDSKTIGELRSRVSDQETSIATLQQDLGQWKDAEKKAVAMANDTEGKRAKLADLSIHLQRTVDDQKRKNTQMYQLGMEVLNRYEKFGLGDALTAKEPFIGVTRTKFETLVQDYEDKLTDQLITDQKTADTKPKP